MDDLDRLFALVDLASDPKTAKKNADEMKELKVLKEENRKILKEAKEDRIAAAEERKKVQEAWREINSMRTVARDELAGAESDRKAAQQQREAAQKDVEKKKAELRAIENEHAKKLSGLQSELKAIETKIADAQARRMRAEEELESVRKIVGG